SVRVRRHESKSPPPYSCPRIRIRVRLLKGRTRILDRLWFVSGHESDTKRHECDQPASAARLSSAASTQSGTLQRRYRCGSPFFPSPMISTTPSPSAPRRAAWSWYFFGFVTLVIILSNSSAVG